MYSILYKIVDLIAKIVYYATNGVNLILDELILDKHEEK